MSLYLRLLLPFLLSLVLCQSTVAASLAEQRRYYDEAKQALAKGDSTPYRQYAEALKDYPLLAHLAYDELTGRLKYAADEEIETFLKEHADLPQINWMKLRWLRWLAERGQWQTFAKYYSPSMNFTELDCLYARYLLSSNKKAEKKAGMAATQKLWLVGKSQPEACDALFEDWKKAGGLNDRLRWQRAVLAAEAGNYSLSRYLTRNLSHYRTEAALLLEVARNAKTIRQTGRFSKRSAAMADVLALGLRRLLREDMEKALELLNAYNKKQHFDAATRLVLARSFGLTLAKRFDERALALMSQYDPASSDEALSEWRIRLLLRLGRYAEAHQRIKELPQPLAISSRWRYWRARSLQLTEGANKEAEERLRALASGRGFYEFMAADLLGLPEQLNHHPLPGAKASLEKAKKRAPVQRALEYLARGEDNSAWYEWYNALNYLPQDEQVALARFAYDKRWHFQVIRTLALAEYWDDLELRFPLPYRGELQLASSTRRLPPSWAFAIARQESAFRADARSSAGALGLMQIMPATARATARKFDIPLKNDKDLLSPNTNIALGTAYLAQLQEQFGSRVLASAAYNAGPTRVRSWLKDTSGLPWDVWVENIPFDETRQYVQNVLAYTVIYGHRLGLPQPFLQDSERLLPSN